MAEYKVTGTDLENVADAIRTKGGTSAGLYFPDGFVTAIGNIPTGGGGEPTLITKSISANGTYDAEDDDADGYSSVTVAVPTGSRLVSGTFTPSSANKGSSVDISIPYAGNGYPISCVIYPSVGSYKSGSDIYELIQDKVITMFCAAKNDIGTAPDYLDNSNLNKNGVFSFGVYKYGTSDKQTYSSGMSRDYAMYVERWGASESNSACVRFKSATKMAVFVANTSYGFKDGIEYTYEIVYSA